MTHHIEHTWKVLLDATNDLRVYVLEIVVLHPLFSQVLTQIFWIEHKLHERVHFVCLLALNELLKIWWGQLVKSEEAEISKDAVKGHVIPVQL